MSVSSVPVLCLLDADLYTRLCKSILVSSPCAESDCNGAVCSDVALSLPLLVAILSATGVAMYLWYHDGCMCQCRSTTSSSHVLELHDLRAKRTLEASAAAPHARRPSRRPSLAEAAADPDAIAVLDAIRFDSDDDDDEDEEGAGTNADDLDDGDVGDESASGSHRASNTSAGTAVLAAGGGSGGNDRDSSRGGASLRPAEKEAKRRGRRAVWCWKFGRYYTSIVVVCSFVVSASVSHHVTLWVADKHVTAVGWCATTDLQYCCTRGSCGVHHISRAY